MNGVEARQRGAVRGDAELLRDFEDVLGVYDKIVPSRGILEVDE